MMNQWFCHVTIFCQNRLKKVKKQLKTRNFGRITEKMARQLSDFFNYT